MGEDGHIASLFPNHSYPEDQMVVVERYSPKPPKERISMSYQQLNKTHYVLKLIIGKSKGKVVKLLGQNSKLPIERVNGIYGKSFVFQVRQNTVI
jgi:6-phosphogluconolactonase